MPRVRLPLIALAMVALLGACSATTTEITAVADIAPVAEAPDDDDTSEPDPVEDPSPPAGAADDAADTPDDAADPPAATDAGGEPSDPAEPAAPPATSRVVPDGWVDQYSGSYLVALPPSWSAMTSIDEIDEILDAAAGQVDIPAAAIQQYRNVLEGGNAVIAIGTFGDNFNAFRQRGGAQMLSQPEEIQRQFEQQFAAIAQNVSVETTPRFYGDTPGVVTSGQYQLSGQTFYLYQFSTAVDDYVYFFTVTLLTGPDQTLADQVFNSIAFG